MLDWLFETAIIGALLAAVAWLVCRAVRLSPALRHTLWLVVLLKLLTPAGVAWQVPENWIVWQDVAITSAAVRYPAESISLETSPVELPGDLSEEAIIEEMLSAAAAVKNNLEPVENKVAVADSPIVGPTPTWREQVAELPWRSWLLAAWSIGTLLVVLRQLQQLVRWQRLIRSSEPAPEHLINHVRILAGHLRMRAPEVRVIEGLPSPVIWCLGRPRLLWPARLVDVDAVSSHAGVIVHELAHLKRRDHWVARLELLATSIWWWNPVWWVTRGRLRETADLACDAWVVWTLPEDRRTYAESLIELSSVSRKKQSAVAFTLGATDNVCRDFERRLTMIVKSNWPRRVSVLNLTLIVLLAFVVLPKWMMADGADGTTSPNPPTASTAPQNPIRVPEKPKPNPVETAPIDDELEPVASVPVAAPEPELESAAVESVSEDFSQVGPVIPQPADPAAATEPTSPFDDPVVVPSTPPAYAQPVDSPFQQTSPLRDSPYTPTEYNGLSAAPKSRKTLLRVFQLKHRDPGEMLQLIRPIWGSLQQAGYVASPQNPSRISHGGAGHYPKPVQRVARPQAQVSAAIPSRAQVYTDGVPVLQIDKLRVLADADSKSLIARGPAEMVGFVESLVKAFDVPEGAPIGKIEHPNTHTFNLRKRDAFQIVDIAKKLGLNLNVIFPSSTAVNSYSASKPTVRLPHDIKTLIVAGNKEELEDIARLIEALDPPADVLQEAVIDKLLEDVAIPVTPAKNQFRRRQ